METQKLAVVQHGDHWRIVDPDGLRGEVLTYDEAMARAERLARRAYWQGCDIDLLVHRGAELTSHLSLRSPAAP